MKQTEGTKTARRNINKTHKIPGTSSLPLYLDSSGEDEDVEIPEWAEYTNVKKQLKQQSDEKLYALFHSDLFHPPIDKIMQMTPSAAKKFQKRNSSADWTHIRDEPSQRKRDMMMNHKEMINLQKKWNVQDFELGRTLGKGRFATVYLARERKTNYLVVLKVIYKSILAKFQAEKPLRNEIEIQAHLRHANIVQIYGYFYDSDRIYLILEYAMYGDIFNDVQLCRLDEKTAASYVYQLSKGLQHLHDNFVIHRDIKLENVYLSLGGTIKIGDFGWAIHTHKLKHSSIVGTLHYMAPEMLLQEIDYDHKVDNWALGVLLYEMLIGELPFYGRSEEELENDILYGTLKIPGFVRTDVAELIKSLLDRNPKTRIELKDVMNHKWILKHVGVKSLRSLCINYIQQTMEYYRYDLSGLSSQLRSEISFDSLHHRFFSE